MPTLLAVVKTLEEAAAALAGGADEAAVMAAREPQPVLEGLVEGHIGWLMWPAPVVSPLATIREMKNGAGPRVWLPIEADDTIRSAQAAGHAVVGLIDAEANMSADTLAKAKDLGLMDVLVTTPPFSGRHLLTVRGIGDLSRIADLCRAAGLRFGFAGALEPPDVSRIQALGLDVIGLDDALRDPSDRFDPTRLAAFRAAVSPPPREAEPVRLDDKLDRIFIRDWTVSMSIGAYARERGQAQRVRFAVEAEVAPAAPGAGMAGVVSYDLITDAIARLAIGHIDLVEDLAERLAESVLAEPRVLSIDVTIEKLDVGPGSVGCRIFRRRGPM